MDVPARTREAAGLREASLTMYKQYRTDMGIQVAAIRRPLPNVEAELTEDLKPFFHVVSLFQHADRTGISPPRRGRLSSLKAPTLDSLVLVFNPQDASPVEVQLSNVRSSLLTIWRVNDVLDALQAFIETDEIVVYLQTGGDALSHALAECVPVGSSTGPRAVDLFNEPIISLRVCGSRARLP